MEKSRAHLYEGEQQAAVLIRDLGFEKSGPIPVEDIAFYRGIQVVVGRLDGAEARLTRLGRHGIMRLNDRSIDLHRRRFSVGHELGHWEMDGQEPGVTQCDGGVEAFAAKTSAEERANAFASEILMPKDLVEPMVLRKEPALPILEGIAQIFQVSLTASALRFLRFTGESFYVVRVAADGRISWWKRSARGGLALQGKQQVDPDTVAARILRGLAGAGKPTVVDPLVWFNELHRGRRAEVTETSILAGQYGGTLTFLSVVEYEIERRGSHKDDEDDEDD